MQKMFLLWLFVVIVTLSISYAEDNRPVRLSVSLTSLYTDNRDSAPKGGEEDNIDLSIRPRVEIGVDRGDSSLLFTYTPSYRYRTEPREGRDESELLQELIFDGTYGFSPRSSVRFMDNFYITDDPEVQKYGTTGQRGSTFLFNNAKAKIVMAMGPRVSGNLELSHAMKKYDDNEIAKNYDEEGSGAMAGLYFPMSKVMGVKILAKYDTYDYNNSYGLKRGIDTMAGAAGFDYIVSEQIRSELRLGWIQASYEEETIGDQNAPYVDLVFRIRPQPDTQFTIEGGHSIRNSDVFPYPSQEETRGSVSLDWKVQERLKVDFGGQYRIGSYEFDIDPIPAWIIETGVKEGDEKKIILTAGVTFDFGDYTSLRVGQSYQKTDSEVSVDFVRNDTMLTLTRKF